MCCLKDSYTLLCRVHVLVIAVSSTFAGRVHCVKRPR